MRKKWIILNAVLLLVSLAAVWVMMSTVTDAGISDISSVSKLQAQAADANVSGLKYTAEEIQDNKVNYLADITKDGRYVHSEIEIFVVTPKEDIEIMDTMYRQDCTVDKVVQGAQIKGETVSVYIQGGLMLTDEGIRFIGNYGKNVMLPGNRYLIFTEKVENSEYIEQIDCKYKYRTIYALFNVLNLSSDYSYVPASDEEVSYASYDKSEFITSSQETLDELVKIKHEIISSYLKE